MLRHIASRIAGSKMVKCDEVAKLAKEDKSVEDAFESFFHWYRVHGGCEDSIQFRMEDGKIVGATYNGSNFYYVKNKKYGSFNWLREKELDQYRGQYVETDDMPLSKGD